MDKLYVHTEEAHNLLAPTELVPILVELFKPTSILDVGCGIGNWLKVFEDQGIKDYLGLDGDYIDRKMLMISEDKLLTLDLSEEFFLKRKFDLVISFEVAEHLPENRADAFVKSLVSHGDVILFSAAIPGQGGQNHLNEQWPSYWQKKFESHNYYFHDRIRPLIWNNSKINSWYKQNIFLVTREFSDQKILPVVHPDLFSAYLRIINAPNSRSHGWKYHLKMFISMFYRNLFD